MQFLIQVYLWVIDESKPGDKVQIALQIVHWFGLFVTIMDRMFMSPQNVYVETLKFSGRVLRIGAFER